MTLQTVYTPEDRGPSTSKDTDLARQVAKLTKINAALMRRVERSMEQQGNAYSLFQTAIGLESQVRSRTDELKSALHNLEKTNGQLLAARDAAELANRLKTRFFTAVGHDLLQPLHAARLTLSAMVEEPEVQNGRQLSVKIDHALSTIEDLLKTLLDLSKLEAGAMQPSFQAVPVRELFRSLVLEFEPLAHARGLLLRDVCGDDAILSDPLMLRRMVQNLLVNALHYTAHGGVKLVASRRGSVVTLSVFDSGPGIPPVEQKRIFEEFQRGSAAEQSGRGGMGLGLAIVQRIAAALGHPLDLNSKVGRGTRFTLTVPYAGLAPPLTRTGAGAPAHGFAGARVIVIENDNTVLEAMQTLLGRWSCETTCIRDLRDIPNLVQQEPTRAPQLVVADYHLDRRQCGLDGISRIRDLCGTAIPAMVVTADHSNEIAQAAARLGCEMLYKPVKPAELRALMLHLLSQDLTAA